jgi:hypothetical protein
MDNYMQYSGQTRVSVSMFQYERSTDCLVCSRKELAQNVPVSQMLQDYIEKIKTDLKLKAPQIMGQKGMLVGKGIYEAECEPKLKMTFG